MPKILQDVINSAVIKRFIPLIKYFKNKSNTDSQLVSINQCSCVTNESVVEDEVEKELIESVVIALESLSHIEQQVIQCIYYDGLTLVETSKYLSLTNDFINSTHLVSLRKLKQLIQDNGRGI